MTCKKVLRASGSPPKTDCRSFTSWISAGVSFPPDEVFPDERRLRPYLPPTTPVISARVSRVRRDHGQLRRRCGYLPVLCDTLLMTEGSACIWRGPGAGEGRNRSGGGFRVARRATGYRLRSVASRFFVRQWAGLVLVGNEFQQFCFMTSYATSSPVCWLAFPPPTKSVLSGNTPRGVCTHLSSTARLTVVT